MPPLSADEDVELDDVDADDADADAEDDDVDVDGGGYGGQDDDDLPLLPLEDEAGEGGAGPVVADVAVVGAGPVVPPLALGVGGAGFEQPPGHARQCETLIVVTHEAVPSKVHEYEPVLIAWSQLKLRIPVFFVPHEVDRAPLASVADTPEPAGESSVNVTGVAPSTLEPPVHCWHSVAPEAAPHAD